jgi:hypothetical protein
VIAITASSSERFVVELDADDGGGCYDGMVRGKDEDRDICINIYLGFILKFSLRVIESDCVSS